MDLVKNGPNHVIGLGGAPLAISKAESVKNNRIRLFLTLFELTVLNGLMPTHRERSIEHSFEG